MPTNSGNELVNTWPSENLVAVGQPTGPISAPVYLRELSDGYAMSAVGFQSCGEPLDASDIVEYLTADHWDWECVPVENTPNLTWTRPSKGSEQPSGGVRMVEA